MKYQKLYTFLVQRKRTIPGFNYTDRSGWRIPNPTYIERIRQLEIIAEDPATRRRFWISHEGNIFRISICQMDENGSNIGPTHSIHCHSRADLAETFQKLFLMESQENQQITA